MISMTCDRCEIEVDPEVNGAVRAKLGNTELTFHLCHLHQSEFMGWIQDWLKPDRIRVKT